MYDKQAGLSVPTNEPDFSRIISYLREETASSQNLSEQLYYVSNGLKPMIEQKSNENDLKQLDEPGIVGLLWTELRKLRQSNEVLKRVNEHMRGVLGT